MNPTGFYINLDELKDKVAKIGNVPNKLLRKGIRRGFASLTKEILNKQKMNVAKAKEDRAAREGRKSWPRQKNGLLMFFKYGNLYRAMGQKITVNMGKSRAYFVVGPRKKMKGNPSRYAHLLENGVKPHQIKCTKGRLAGRTIKHPGMKAQPWLKPSFAGIPEKTLQVVISEIERTFQEEMR